MAFGTFVIYASDGTTPVSIPQPDRATWERAVLGNFLDGAPRLAARAIVEWQFAPMTLAQYQNLVAARPVRGLVKLVTYRAGEASPNHMATCNGVMAAVVQGEEAGGQYAGVAVRFTGVYEL